MRRISAFLLMLLLATFVAVPVMAQDTGTNAGTYEDRDDDGPDYGWIGLLGLAGLLGLRRRNPEPYRDTAPRTTTGAATR